MNVIEVGASKESVAAVHAMIMDILESEVDQSTIVEALKASTEMCKVSNVSISECSFYAESPKVQNEEKQNASEDAVKATMIRAAGYRAEAEEIIAKRDLEKLKKETL